MNQQKLTQIKKTPVKSVVTSKTEQRNSSSDSTDSKDDEKSSDHSENALSSWDANAKSFKKKK